MRTTTYAVHIGEGATLIAKRTEIEGRVHFAWLQPNYDQVIGRLTPDIPISSFGDITSENVVNLADLTHYVNACKSEEELTRERIVSQTEALLLQVGNGRDFNAMRFFLKVAELYKDATLLAGIKIGEVEKQLKG